MPYNYYPVTIYNDILVTDILKKFKFSDEFKKSTFVENYVIKDEDTPESLAYYLYGDATLSWLILSLNSISDRNNDWPMDYASFERMLDDKYPGSCVFLEDSKIDFVLSDAVRFVVSGDDYNIVKTDRSFNKITTDTVLPLSVNTGDTVTFYNSSDEILKQTTLDRVVYEEEYSVHHFEYENEYFDPRDFDQQYSTIIRRYVLGFGEEYLITNKTYEQTQNDKKRDIILILPEYKDTVISNIRKLFNVSDKNSNIVDIKNKTTIGDISE